VEKEKWLGRIDASNGCVYVAEQFHVLSNARLEASSSDDVENVPSE
jgi:hypothetical protein